MAKQRRKKVVCSNCKVNLNENVNFCHNCGQENHDKRASVKMLVNDFSQDYFTFDSKLFRSLKPLLFNPGFLTLEFINGKRMNYIRPIRLYLFISFIYFLTSSLLSYDSVDITINSENDSKSGIIDNEELYEEYKTETLKKIAQSEKEGNTVKTYFLKLGLKIKDKKNQDNLNNSMNRNIPIFFFLTIPLLGLILFLIFYSKKRFYVDHLIFALHLQSFIFIILFITAFFKYFELKTFGIPFLLILIYSIIAAKKTYQKTYIGSFFRLLASATIHFIISIILFVFFLWIVVFSL